MTGYPHHPQAQYPPRRRLPRAVVVTLIVLGAVAVLVPIAAVVFVWAMLVFGGVQFG